MLGVGAPGRFRPFIGSFIVSSFWVVSVVADGKARTARGWAAVRACAGDQGFWAAGIRPALAAMRRRRQHDGAEVLERALLHR